MKWRKALPSSHQRNLIEQYPELPTDAARGKKKRRNKNCGINHLPSSAGSVTPDHLEALGSFQAGKTSLFYLRFQPGFELTALHRRSRALSHPCSQHCSAVCSLFCTLQFFGLGTNLAVLEGHCGCAGAGQGLLTQHQ